MERGLWQERSWKGIERCLRGEDVGEGVLYYGVKAREKEAEKVSTVFSITFYEVLLPLNNFNYSNNNFTS